MKSELVLSLESACLFCIVLRSQIVANISSIYPNDTEAPPAGVDDMTKLAYLHEPGVLYNLACRFSLNEIYVSQSIIFPAVKFSTNSIGIENVVTNSNKLSDVERWMK